MRPAALACRRVLVVAPHPDDEAIGAWALMRHLSRTGARINVLVVSDGGASHPQSRRWPRQRLTRERRQETLRAMRTLAIPPAQVQFLDLPDGELEARADHVAGVIAQRLRRTAPPDLIVGPISHDAHGDHRAVARALERLPHRGERRLGYQVWPEGARSSANALSLRLDTRTMIAKRRVVRSYRTQAGLITDATAGFAMTHRHLRAFVRPTERFTVLA